MTAAPEPILLSAEDAAKALGISRRTLFSLTNRQANPIPSVRPVPGRVMYRPADLRAWISQHVDLGGHELRLPTREPA